MNPIILFVPTYWDDVFMRAVELGCEPVNLGTVSAPAWGCTCAGRTHTNQYGRPVITAVSLTYVERKMLL